MTEYKFSQSSSPAELLATLQKLCSDAKERAMNFAYEAVSDGATPHGGVNDSYINAYGHAEKERLLKRLIWAFSGKAEDEGCPPLVDID